MGETAEKHDHAHWAAILQQAGKLLSPRPAGHAEPTSFALDRALRVIRHLERLAALTGVDIRPGRLHMARVAALYACHADNHAAARPGPAAADDAAELATDQLKKFFNETDLETIAAIVRQSRRKNAELAEAQLLSDAIALEDMGLIGLWNQMRVVAARGRSLEHLIKLWKTQQDYGYWHARLADSFYHDASRQLATRRMMAVGPIYAQLEQQQLGNDVV